jgi:hypothetical protein
MRYGVGRLAYVGLVLLAAMTVSACAGGLTTADGRSGTMASGSMSPDEGTVSPTAPPSPLPFDSLDCGPSANGVTLSSGADGPGATTAPAKQAAQLASLFMAKYPGAQQRLFYGNETRMDFVYEEPDGTRRGYVSFVLRDGLWASNGEAFCSRA